jgi:hypothetical protein
MTRGFRNYDSWRTTDEAAERAAAYEEMRDKLADKRGCSPDFISDDDLNDWLNELTADRDAAREDYDDRLKEEER